MIAALMFWVLSCSAFSASAQWIDYPTKGTPRTRDGSPNLTASAPRARDGKPDLSGIWEPDYSPPVVPPGTVVVTSLGPFFSLQSRRPDAAPIPMTPWAEAIFKERDRTFGADRPSAHCLPHSIPDAMLVDNFKIVQDPGLTLILYEEFARFRQIFTDGRGYPQEMNPAWFGYSIGKWDRETFVVDTAGFNDRSWLDDAGHPHSEKLRTIERFHRRDFGHLDLQITIEDPVAYTEPWSFALHFHLMADTELIENMCDNEKDEQHLVGRVDTDDKKIGIEVSSQILSRYVGVYEFKAAGAPSVTMEISMGQGHLILSGSELTPLSETEFSGSYGVVKFLKDAQGKVTSMIVDWATGDEDVLTPRAAGPSSRKK
jgi:hypothetical protein